ncbi:MULTISPECIES: GNAT family N-acetyltransferase [Streptomyces]|uniref:GNAT family N-acetyltransferase n=1 Tax=Streptomyces chilikensis TaxID=1194079 RepID=A0ABV3ERP2_9ACTN|nr:MULTISPECIES: GNAT family N-acetyltransferase [Streptomyces]MDH6227302.1 ribosomal protein S18 acetylase RimI-like enzyme [Streptomyces sp. MJP52]
MPTSAEADTTTLIRPARPEDGEALNLLERETWSSLHAVTPPPEPGQPFFDERHPVGDLLVAELDGEVVGYVRVARPTPLEVNAHVLQIQGLVLSERARGRGLGKALMRAAEEEARRRGARRLTLRVLGHNAPARALYTSLGYAVEGILPEEMLLDGEYVDDVLMGRFL